jgi:hypothetical protein
VGKAFPAGCPDGISPTFGVIMATTDLRFSGTDEYYLDPELGGIVNIALQMEKPLLITGEAGTGKTQLAFQVARSLGMNIEVLRCKSTIKGEEACYTQDTVLRLNDAASERGRPAASSTTSTITLSGDPSAARSGRTGNAYCFSTRSTRPSPTCRTTCSTSLRITNSPSAK